MKGNYFNAMKFACIHLCVLHSIVSCIKKELQMHLLILVYIIVTSLLINLNDYMLSLVISAYLPYCCNHNLLYTFCMTTYDTALNIGNLLPEGDGLKCTFNYMLTQQLAYMQNLKLTHEEEESKVDMHD